MTVDQVLAETSRWPSEQVEKLFESLLMSNYRLPDPEMDTARAEEIKRRIDDIEAVSGPILSRCVYRLPIKKSFSGQTVGALLQNQLIE